MNELLSAAPFASFAATDGHIPQADEFRADVLQGLCASGKSLPCKYFYDRVGAQLFEQICELPEYYPTRTELGILRQHVAEMAQALGPNCLVMEYGSGSGIKTRLLLDHLPVPATYVPVDISREQLLASAALLARDYPAIHVHALCCDFTQHFDLPVFDTPSARRVVYFPGSTIGNLMPHEAVQLLRRTAKLCGHHGGLLIGVDLKKSPRLLHAAYNDSAGVTAAFNLNVLKRINNELGADFRLDRYWHHAFYSPAESRIEMHLVSSQDQGVLMAGQPIFIAEGESIRTEYSYKYSLRDLGRLAASSGFRVERMWSDENNHFAVQYWTVIDRASRA